MHSELEYLEAIEIIKTAMTGMDYKSLLSARNIRLHDDVLKCAIEEAALDMVTKSWEVGR